MRGWVGFRSCEFDWFCTANRCCLGGRPPAAVVDWIPIENRKSSPQKKELYAIYADAETNHAVTQFSSSIDQPTTIHTLMCRRVISRGNAREAVSIFCKATGTHVIYLRHCWWGRSAYLATAGLKSQSDPVNTDWANTLYPAPPPFAIFFLDPPLGTRSRLEAADHSVDIRHFVPVVIIITRFRNGLSN